MSITRQKHIIIAAIILCIVLIFGCILVYAKTPDAPKTNFSRNKYFTSYQIQPGDTLHSIAKKYMTYEYSSEKEYFEELRFINDFRGDIIFAGSYIICPYYAE